MCPPQEREIPCQGPEGDDRLLLYRVINDKDREALGTLYAAYYPRLVRYVARQLGRTADGEDLAQDVFLRLLETRARYDMTASAQAYLFVVVKRLMAERRRCRIRRERRLTRESVDSASRDRAGLELSEGAGDSPGHPADDRIGTVITSLSPRACEAIQLHVIRGLSIPEAARAAGCSVPAFYSRLERALQTLRRRRPKEDEQGTSSLSHRPSAKKFPSLMSFDVQIR
jgi:RNA polymerase sigma factor (sigma-70 family)